MKNKETMNNATGTNSRMRIPRSSERSSSKLNFIDSPIPNERASRFFHAYRNRPLMRSGHGHDVCSRPEVVYLTLGTEHIHGLRFFSTTQAFSICKAGG